ncbi:MAG: hypothetical protein MSH66_06300 [Bacteroidales bacterium]|nr:hypothetical protein [Bacteroidales bacterium]
MTRSILKGLACAMCLAAGLLTACKDNKKGEAQSEKRTEMEERAQEYLANARKSLAQKDFAAARQSIEQMRKDCYLALSGRRQGILLMDSIDCADAQQQLVKLDSLVRQNPDDDGLAEQFEEKCKEVDFYKKKIVHDRKAMQQEMEDL